MARRKAAPTTAGAPHILLVEDDDATRVALAEALTGAGYRVRTAPDSALGLAELERRRPDAIVLDVVTPGWDAATFRAVQRVLPGGVGVPVLLISATAADRLERLAREVGVDAWLSKPFGVEEFVAAVARLTGR
ncbi:MAG TPA: response regulator [Chloroflexota bacterium]